MSLRKFPFPAHQERGASLIVVLMILVIISLLGIGAAQLVLMAERATRYDRDRAVAWQAANAALVDARMDLETGNRSAMFTSGSKEGFTEGCGTSGTDQGLCAYSSTSPGPYAVDFTATGTDAHTVEFGTFTGRTFTTGAGIAPAQLPRYVIEVLDSSALAAESGSGVASKTSGTTSTSAASGNLYRVTAMGFGPDTAVQVVLQMIYKKTSA